MQWLNAGLKKKKKISQRELIFNTLYTTQEEIILKSIAKTIMNYGHIKSKINTK